MVSGAEPVLVTVMSRAAPNVLTRWSPNANDVGEMLAVGVPTVAPAGATDEHVGPDRTQVVERLHAAHAPEPRHARRLFGGKGSLHAVVDDGDVGPVQPGQRHGLGRIGRRTHQLQRMILAYDLR